MNAYENQCRITTQECKEKKKCKKLGCALGICILATCQINQVIAVSWVSKWKIVLCALDGLVLCLIDLL